MADIWTGGGFGFPPALVRQGCNAPGPSVQISVDGWTAASDAKAPRDGSWVATLARWSGWTGGWSVQTDEEQSPTGDGTLAGVGVFGARTITVGGLILASTHARDYAAMNEAYDRLAATLAGARRKAVLTVTENGVSRECDVRLSQAPDADEQPLPWAGSWSLYLRADDPLRYGVEATTVTGSGFVPNRGTAISRPLVDLHGPMTDPTITAGGNTWRAKASIPAGQYLTVDMRRRVVLDSNGRKTFTPTSGYWHHVDPGGATFKIGGGGKAVFRRSSAWM